MIKKNLLLSLLFVLAIPANAQEEQISLSQLDSIALPTVIVNTIDGEEPTHETAFPPEGAFGVGIKNANKVPGEVMVRFKGDTLFYSGAYGVGDDGMTIKIRGNTSAGYQKKPFKIKLNRKADLLCRGDEFYYDKDWVLLRSGANLLTKAGLLTASMVHTNQWTPAHQYVNLVFNGEYRGVYILIEGVERNGCRLAVDKQSGFIAELDPYWWLEDVFFDTSHTNTTRRYTLKYPDQDDVTPEQITEIKNCIKEAEYAIKNGNYNGFIDIESFARWMLAHDILGTWDSAGSNIFVVRNDSNSLLQMGNLWDFDTSFKTTDNWARVHYDYFYYKQLFSSPNKDFVRKYKEVWNEVKDFFFTDIIDELEQYSESTEGEALNRSLELNKIRWEDDGDEFVEVPEQTQILIDWFREREIWLENAIAELDDSGETAITRPEETTAPDNDNTLRDLSGRIVTNPTKGIYIRNGKKIVIQ